MKKFIIILYIFTLNLIASNMQINGIYDIEYGSFLPLGTADAKLIIDEKNNYELSISAQTTGLVKVLSNNRSEEYKSLGKIINGQFIPEKFIKIKKDNVKERIREYTIDKNDKKIYVDDYTEIKSKFYDSKLNVKYKTLKAQNNYILDYFAKDDILSLFFNLKEKFSKFKQNIDYKLKALGANKTKGIINIFIPKDKKEINKYLNTKSNMKFIAYINQKIFQSERGELLISINKKGFCDYAVLKDVLLFGDIKGELVSLKVTN